MPIQALVRDPGLPAERSHPPDSWEIPVNRTLLSFFFLTAAVAMAGQPDSAPNWWDDLGQLPPADRPIASVIDAQISARLRAENVQPAPPAPEETQLRRATLDLAGRIPTLAERTAFLADSSPDRWQKAVERLLDSPSFVRHQAHELNWLLRDGKSDDFRNYLLAALKEDRRWNEIFEEVILAETSEANKGADKFVRESLRDLDKLTAQVSVRFFGVDISCAQCHDHPYVQDWTQETYYGMQSFFNRSFDNGGFVAEHEYGLVGYKTTTGEEKKAALRFLGGEPISEPAESGAERRKQRKKQLDEAKKAKKSPPAPNYSRRAALVEQAAGDAQADYLARALVNRVWHRFFGRGLVTPLDQLHGQNAPSHPELLQWLARDLRAHRYDLRRLMRGIVLSETWRRTSRWDGGERPAAELFAVANPRPLTPRQYGIAVTLGLADPATFGPEIDAKEAEKRLEQIERTGEGLANRFERPKEHFHVAVTEALYFSNSPDVANRIRGSGLFRALQKRSASEQVETAIRSILGRESNPAESRLLAAYLEKRAERPDEALEQMFWALLTSNEGRFNH